MMNDNTDKLEIQVELDPEEVKMNEWIIVELTKKKDVASARGAATTKFIQAIDEVKKNIQTDPMVVKLVKEYCKILESAEKKVRLNASVMSIGETITRYNFHFCRSGAATWYYQSDVEDEFGNRNWFSVKKDTLQVAFPATDVWIRGGEGIEDYSSFKEFNKMMGEQGRIFGKVTQSFTDQTDSLNIMQKVFCPAAADGSSDYHWIFDALVESISGGSPGDDQSFEPMQRTIWSKYLHPDNPYLPNPFVRDDEGRAGKGLLGNTFMRRLFHGSVADNCNNDHVTGKFNSVIAGKVIIIVNETSREKVDVEKKKAFLGSPSIIIEAKYGQPYYADQVALVFDFTNSTTGGVTLSGTKSDNRYSMFETKNTLYGVCQKYFKDVEGVDMTEVEIKHWIEGKDDDSGQNLLFNKEQVGKWINAMALKHGDVTKVDPVHCDAYQSLIDRQRGAWTDTVVEVFEDPNFEYIRADLMSELVREYNKGEIIPGKKRMREEIERICRDKGILVEHKDRVNITNKLGSVQRTVWRKIGVGNCVEDEGKYGERDQNGRRIWNWK